MGGMGSGKTTVADHLLKHLKNGKKLTIAKPIKNIESNLDIMTNDEIIDEYIKPYATVNTFQRFIWKNIFDEARKIPKDGGKNRKRLQYIGTDGGRLKIHNNIWIDIAVGMSKTKPDVTWVVDDCRFKNEAEAFFKEGWLPVFLFIEPRVQVDRLIDLYGDAFDPKTLNHASEVELKEILIPTKSIFISYDDIEKTLANIKAYVWDELT